MMAGVEVNGNSLKLGEDNFIVGLSGAPTPGPVTVLHIFLSLLQSELPSFPFQTGKLICSHGQLQ